MKSFYEMLLKMEADQPPAPPAGGDNTTPPPPGDPSAAPPPGGGDMGGMPGADGMGGQPQAKPKKFVQATTAWDALKDVLKGGDNKQKTPLPPKKDEPKAPNFKSLIQ